jgi:hypothetical protein
MFLKIGEKDNNYSHGQWLWQIGWDCGAIVGGDDIIVPLSRGVNKRASQRNASLLVGGVLEGIKGVVFDLLCVVVNVVESTLGLLCVVEGVSCRLLVVVDEDV